MPTSIQRVFGIKGGGRPPVMFREGVTSTAANQFAYGDVVQLASNVVIAAKDPTASGNVSSGTPLLGIVLANSRNLAASGTVEDTPVIVFDDTMQFLLPFYHTTPANTYASAVLLGTQCRYGVRNLSSTSWIPCADLTGTTNTNIQFVDHLPGFAATDPYAWGWFRVLQAQRAFL